MVSYLKCIGGKPHPYYTRASRADAGDHKGPLPPSTPRSPLRITRPPACLRGFSLPEVDACWGDACVAPARQCATQRYNERDGGRAQERAGGLARATQASPRRVHTAPAPTRLAGAQRPLKRPRHQLTPERQPRLRPYGRQWGPRNPATGWNVISVTVPTIKRASAINASSDSRRTRQARVCT